MIYSSVWLTVKPSDIIRSRASSRSSSGSLKRARACLSVRRAELIRSLILSLSFRSLSLFERPDWEMPSLAAASDWDIPYSVIRRFILSASKKP